MLICSHQAILLEFIEIREAKFLAVRKSFSIFVAVVILSITGVLFFSIDSETFLILKNADGRLLLLALVLVVCGWMIDGVKLLTLVRAAGERLPFRKILPIIWINYFGSAITPMQSGGGPFQIYMLYKNGVCVGKSVAITLVRTVQIIVLLALVVPFAIIKEPEFLHQHRVVKWFVVYVVAFITALTCFIVVSVIRPKWIKYMSSGILVKMRRASFIVKPRILISIARRINAEIDTYNENIRQFLSGGKYWFILSIFVAVVHLCVYLSIMPVLILAVGFPVEFFQCILVEALFLFLLYFVPTPGGSGAAEGGAAAVLALFVPWNLAGVLAIVWRVFSEYTGVALGTVVAVGSLGWGGADRVMMEKEKEDGKQGYDC